MKPFEFIGFEPGSLSIPIEIKKTYICEWSRRRDPDAIRTLEQALRRITPVILETFEHVIASPLPAR